MEATPAVDPRWLAARLERRGHRARFDAIEYELLGRFSTEVWRLRLVGRGAEALPRLVLKRPYRPPRRGESPELEARLYERLADALPVAMPSFIGRCASGLLVTEVPDLKPFDFRSGPDPAHAARAMEALAALHAAHWNRTAGLQWVPRLSDPSLRGAWQADYDEGWRRNRSRLGALCPEFVPIGDALVGRLAEALEPAARPEALLHGDAHGENLPAASDGAVVLLDWESARIGSPGFDTAVFATMSYPVRERRAVEEGLVERHRRSLRALGVAWDEPWTGYRRGVLRRAARIAEITARGGLPSLSWVFERCATAAADHRLWELLA